MIAIIDYGIGNIGSIKNMLHKVGEKNVLLAKTAEDVAKADKYILPGVGAFDMGMEMLNRSGMREELDRQVLAEHKPILGICLGMQMLGDGSEEGTGKGLGYIPFQCKKFHLSDQNLKIPHMGWDYVSMTRPDHPLVSELPEPARFYFVHSYYAVCETEENVLMQCDYGHVFTAAVCKDNILGTQFHPEKSHKFGIRLMENFARGI